MGMSKREWSTSDQTQTHGNEASKKRSGHLIAVLEHHREVICTIRFSVDEDDDDQKLPARREVPCASPPVDDDDDDRKLPGRQEVSWESSPFDDDNNDPQSPMRREVPCASPPMDEDYDDPQPPKTGANQIKSVKPPDVGFLCVSQKVHTEDTTDGLAVVHKNGPRYIPSANSSSSNRCKLASVIMAFKTSHGSNRSRKNKAKKSYLKRRKQDACLHPIIPSSSHQAFRDLVDDHFTFVDGGDISNPRIRPPASTIKINM